MYYKDDIRKLCKTNDMHKEHYQNIKGYTHAWTTFTTDKGSFMGSMYVKYINNGMRWVTIRNSSEGWVLHLFYGGSTARSWFKTLNNLKDCLEYGELFLKDKLVMESF